MDAGSLLCQTLDDLRERVQQGVIEPDTRRREYHALKIAATLRLLLLDESPLLIQASAPYRKLKARFIVRPVSADPDSETWFANDLLDPGDTATGEPQTHTLVGGVQTWNRALSPAEIKERFEQGRRRLSQTQTVGYQTLLRLPLARYGSTVITVKDTVRFLSHVAGGVHHGTLEDDHEESIDKVSEIYQIQGLPSIHASVFAVARVVIRGLEPLESRIRATR
jgi:hypothetical protein